MPYNAQGKFVGNAQAIEDLMAEPTATPLPAPVAPLGSEDRAFEIAYANEPARLAADNPEAADRILKRNQQAANFEVQATRHFIENVEPHLRRLGYFEKYGWNDNGHQQVVGKLTQILTTSPEKRAPLLNQAGNDFDYARLAGFIMSEIAPLVAKEMNFAPAQTVDDVIAERQEWISKRRGYGYQRNEVSDSMNQGSQH
jgi:hypothetical protein